VSFFGQGVEGYGYGYFWSPTYASYIGMGIDHDATTNFVANEHIDHSAVSNE
jgi:hypothetical protein